MTAQVFDFKDYKRYLNKRLSGRAGVGRISRSKFSQKLRLHPSYMTRILNGDTHLSLEQADFANEALSHSDDESRYFLLLVELARAGTPGLRSRFDRQLVKERLDHLNRKKKFGTGDAMTDAQL